MLTASAAKLRKGSCRETHDGQNIRQQLLLIAQDLHEQGLSQSGNKTI